LIHPANASTPILSTEFGIIIEINEEHPLNVKIPILSSEFGSVIEPNEEH
jgi:hypothetical protein